MVMPALAHQEVLRRQLLEFFHLLPFPVKVGYYAALTTCRTMLLAPSESRS